MAIQWDFQHLLGGLNALEYFSDDFPLRTWDQFIAFYVTLRQKKGSYCAALYLLDPDVIEEMCNIPEAQWQERHLPPLFGWDDHLDRLTDLGDQMIASRASGSKPKFYPRPEVPAVRERLSRKMNRQEDLIELSRRRSAERKAAHTT